MKNERKQAAVAHRGNALFLILIAVALFAALSYAVTQSGRGSGTISKEQAALAIAGVQQYASTLGQAVKRMSLINGCAGDAMNFASSQWPDFGDNYDNTAAPADKSCDVFDPAGGGVTWQAAATGQYLITGTVGVAGIGGGCSGGTIMLLAAVPLDTCLYINRQGGIANTGGVPPAWGGAAGSLMSDGWRQFGWYSQSSGTNFVCGANLGEETPPASEVTGKPAGCFEDTASSGKYYYYNVLYTQ